MLLSKLLDNQCWQLLYPILKHSYQLQHVTNDPLLLQQLLLQKLFVPGYNLIHDAMKHM